MPFNSKRSTATVSHGRAGKNELISHSMHGVAILQHWGQFCMKVSMSFDAPGYQTGITVPLKVGIIGFSDGPSGVRKGSLYERGLKTKLSTKFCLPGQPCMPMPAIVNEPATCSVY